MEWHERIVIYFFLLLGWMKFLSLLANLHDALARIGSAIENLTILPPEPWDGEEAEEVVIFTPEKVVDIESRRVA